MVIGGASLFGGSGTIVGTVIGALIIAVIQYGLVFINVEPFWQFVAVGVVIIVSVLIDQTRERLTGEAARDAERSASAASALAGVGFDLRRGEVLALAGDNGAGKSTLIKAISGVHQPDEGEIVYRGEPVALRNPRHARELGIETIYQDLALAEPGRRRQHLPGPRAGGAVPGVLRASTGPGCAPRPGTCCTRWRSTSTGKSWACRCAACRAASARRWRSAAPSSGRPSS